MHFRGGLWDSFKLATILSQPVESRSLSRERGNWAGWVGASKHRFHSAFLFDMGTEFESRFAVMQSRVWIGPNVFYCGMHTFAILLVTFTREAHSRKFVVIIISQTT